ncbi:MAG: hypothetical protein KTR30_00995 [Saprospiraceae bacterium]|nr:hypothetical protein [Saprospiraceae bacterium]
MINLLALIVCFSISNRSSSIEDSPCPRNQPVIAYDAKDDAIFLFGGYCSTAKKRLNDLWVFRNNQWKKINQKEAPEARSGHAMVYDAFNDRLLVFGGKNETGQLLNDLWSWNRSAWSQLKATGPVQRQSHALVFNSNTGGVFLFGGSNAEKQSLNDTWIYKDENWKRISSSSIPPARLQHTLTYDSERKKMILFGGFDRTEKGKIVYGDTWEWDEALGWKLIDNNESLARDHHGMAYDFISKSAILFGGYNQGYLGGTWHWRGERWVKHKHTSYGPSARAGKPSLFYNDTAQGVVLFGGWDKGNRPLMDFWKFDGRTSAWSPFVQSSKD